MNQATPVGVIGIGLMGMACAKRMRAAGLELLGYDVDTKKIESFVKLGGKAAHSVAEIAQSCHKIVLAVFNTEQVEETIDALVAAVPAGAGPRIALCVSTCDPDRISKLFARTPANKVRYVEAPVSGSRVPAEQGKLVGMLAGDPEAVAMALPLLRPLCERTFHCGAVPRALHMKLAVNLFLITMVTGLAEATHFAQHNGLDLSVFRDILDAGPMASKVSSLKLSKLVEQDYTVQASIADVLMNATLIFDAARAAGVASPLLDRSRDLFARTDQLGHGKADMAAVILAL